MKKHSEKFLKILSSILVGAGIYGLLYILISMQKVIGHSNPIHIITDLMFFSIVAALIIKGNTKINQHLSNYYKWEVNPIKRFVLQITGNIFFTFGTVLIIFEIYSFFYLRLVWGLNLGVFIPVVKDALIILIIIFVFYQAVYIGLYFFHQWEKSVRESEKLKQENLHSQLHALQNQTSPHFLFNSLNVLTSLIEENPTTAVVFVKRLSEVYRYVLQKTEQHLVELRDEINFINSYLYLQQQRFGNNLITKIDIPPLSLDYYIAPYTLQILFENAIKHNIVSTEKPLSVLLSVDQNNLIVENNIQPKISLVPTTGLGLKNIKNRYKILSDKNIQIINQNGIFRVIIPLLKNRSSFESNNN